MAREVMVPRTDAFMIDIEDNTQKISKPFSSKASLVSLFTKMIRIRLSVSFILKTF
ncbi:MAG: hypothetical protein ACLUSV_06545 [Streptococcus sp.]